MRRRWQGCIERRTRLSGILEETKSKLKKQNNGICNKIYLLSTNLDDLRSIEMRDL